MGFMDAVIKEPLPIVDQLVFPLIILTYSKQYTYTLFAVYGL